MSIRDAGLRGAGRKIELLAPAGNLEKLHYAYQYGADAVYIGMDQFSLRRKADNFSRDDILTAAEVKGDKKLFCAINALFHEPDIRQLKKELPAMADLLIADLASTGMFPFDAFIVSDLGAAALLKSKFPEVPLHLSTQASCLNSEAVRAYRDFGFSRIILGREATLEDIRQIREQVPDIELECFVHGAMCLAYSGRCFLSAYLADRSGNSGGCAHSCRWNWRVLEEKERPGEYFPILEDSEYGYTTLLSSKDLCMIDHIDKLKEAGVDSLKIEGRMKSLYYTAMVTRAYRKGIDAIEEPGSVSNEELAAYREELFRVSHRQYSTGFFFARDDIETPNRESYKRHYLFLGTLGEEIEPGLFSFLPKNQLLSGQEIELIGPDTPALKETNYHIFSLDGVECEKADHGKEYTLRITVPARHGFIIRRKSEDREIPQNA